jgi:hypothetical protein
MAFSKVMPLFVQPAAGGGQSLISRHNDGEAADPEGHQGARSTRQGVLWHA